ncbi:MAG: hypothetical protein M1827_000612 [Pycnora praestabilis]|nr:MAG: hypothetical protein M1827_000612 [Pycnora praestabilis]
MTSVQSAPPLPQGGMSLPANLTNQHVQEVYQKYKQMKQQGVREDDPEYIKAHNLLTAVTQSQAITKQRQAYFMLQQQQQHQQRQQSQQNGASTQPVTNGTNGQSQQPPSTSAPPNQIATANAIPSSLTQAAGAANTQSTPAQATGQQHSGSKAAPQASNTFSQEQLSVLRNQILAFKLLSKNLAIPPAVQQQLFTSQQVKRAPTPAQVITSAGQTLEAASQAEDVPSADSAAGKVEDPKPRNWYDTFTSPYSRLQKSISYGDHASRDKRLMIPSIMPSGVDIDRVREERERIIYNRIVSRKSELEKLPANVAVWDTSKEEAPSGDDSLKLKALIEYKMLCLLPKQRALRQQVSRDMVQHDNLAMTANRTIYRRIKKQSFREARITEKLEQQQRDARESREKKKSHDYLQSILNHGREIQNAANNQRARVQKVGRMMLQHHQHIEKEEQKRVERTAKQRLQALKSNDEETYLKLLGQAKDSRITHLLKQTDGFLSQLAASVKQQQRNAAEHYGDKNFKAGQVDEEEDEDEDEDEDDEDDEEGSKKVDYYAVAHRVKEEIKEQSSNLVGGTLKEYQIKGLQWMISLYNNNLNGILADEMGLGKTIQTISLITYLIEKKQQNGPFLVIVPLSTLTNWNLEFEKWAPSITRIVYKGPPNARKTQQQQIRWGQFQVLLTTYEYIIKDRPVLSKVKWIHMIIDEGHRMKNAQSKLSATLTHYYNTRYRLILTGTPLQNNLPELWALLNFVLPTIFKSVKSFDEWFNTPFANTGGQDKMELSEEEQLLVIRRLHKVLRPFLLRRLKKDVEKDLPDKQERVIKCKFSALQAKLYKQLVSHNKLLVSDGKGGKTGMRGLSNILMQLRKLCNHPFVFDEVEEQMNPGKGSNDLLWRTAGKFELLDRVMPKFKASGHRVLMFFQMTAIMNIMEDFLRLRGLTYLRLDGSTKSDDRSELLKLFNAPDSPYFCFLLSTRAGGLGLNLQTADTVIIYDSDWNPHQDLQAQDRAHRIGQKNEVRILRLITSNSVEEKILEKAQYKLDMDGKVIQAGKFDNKSTNEERDALLRVMLETAEAADQLAEQEEMDDDDLNTIMARSDDELVLFQKMDAEREKNDIEYGPDRKLPRLMGESELPEIYLTDDNPVVEEIEEHAGRGARERTKVKYDDGLTEEQWLDAVDNDEDTIEAAMARRDAKLQRRQVNKDKKSRKSQGEDDSPEPDRDSSEAPLPKKRGRKPNKEKRKAEEAALDEPPAAKRKRGRQPKNAALDTLGSEERTLLQKILNKIYSVLMELEVGVSAESDDDEDGTRPIIDPFVKLPPKMIYPDYYMVIKNPIAMDNIRRKINKEEYQNLKEFRDDVRTLCNNARTYNEDGSVLFQDANAIEAKCVSQLKEETEKHPELADFDDQSSSFGDGQSTAPISSAATPMASSTGPGTKLKLTFNRDAYANGGDSGRQSDDD